MFRIPDITTLMVHAIVLFTVIPVHEFAHGWVANKLGDDTAYHQGRLTLNPFAHLDVVGTIALLLIGFGWAKPVPVNARNFKHPRRDMALSALAGPVANVILAAVVMAVYKIMIGMGVIRYASAAQTFLSSMIWVSLCLAVFNFLPIPPLDGFKIFGAVMPDKWYWTIQRYEQYVFIILIVLLGSGLLSIPLSWGAGLLLKLVNLITMPINWILF